MASLRSPLSCALRSKLSMQSPRVIGEANHTLSSTTRIATASDISPALSKPPVFNSQNIRTPRNPNPASHAPRLVPPTTFETLLNNLTHHLTSEPLSLLHPRISHLHSLLRAYESNSSHWCIYAHANPDKQYTRNLVCEVPGVFNLLLLVWTPGKKSPVHDHADAHCLMKVLKGTLRETRYAIPEFPGCQGRLEETSSIPFGVGKVSYMADSLGLHSISNPHPSEYAVSLHLYTPPNASIRGCHVYDEEDGSAKHVKQCVYDSVCGVVIANGL